LPSAIVPTSLLVYTSAALAFLPISVSRLGIVVSLMVLIAVSLAEALALTASRAVCSALPAIAVV